MKLLNRYDEVKEVCVTDSHIDVSQIKFIDKKTDQEMAGIAAKYFAGNKSVHLKRLAMDNAYLLYKITDIRHGNDRQIQGLMFQYDLLDQKICDVNFFSVNEDRMKCIKSLLQPDFHRNQYTESNVMAMIKDNLSYDKEMVKIFAELGKEFHLAEMDNNVYFKNSYLLLERARVANDFLYKFYIQIKGLDGVENCRYDKFKHNITFIKDGKEKKINIIGSIYPEMDGIYEASPEQMIVRIKEGNSWITSKFYGECEVELCKYSHSHDLSDLVSPKLKSNYERSLVDDIFEERE